jgi:hypothetical protein
VITLRSHFVLGVDFASAVASRRTAVLTLTPLRQKIELAVWTHSWLRLPLH